MGDGTLRRGVSGSLFCAVRGSLLGALIALLPLLAACDGCGRRAPEVDDTTAAEPVTTWSLVGDAPAWVWIDLERLREDPRTRAVWEAAGPAIEPDAFGALDAATTLVLAWRDATFASRLNVVESASLAPLDTEDLAARGFMPYRAGANTVWSRGASSWAIAMPTTRHLLTGTPDAVRAAASDPCLSCGPPARQRPPGTAVTASLRVTDDHRRVASFALSTGAVDRALAEIAHARVDVVLGLGADVLVRFTPVEGADLAFVNLLLTEVLAALRGVLDRTPDAVLAGALIDRAQIRADGDALELTIEISREELDALAGMLAAPASERPVEPNLPEPRAPEEP